MGLKGLMAKIFLPNALLRIFSKSQAEKKKEIRLIAGVVCLRFFRVLIWNLQQIKAGLAEEQSPKEKKPDCLL